MGGLAGFHYSPLPFPYVNTYWDCPGSYPIKPYWYFPKALSDADVCEEFPTAPIQPFICLPCSYTCTFSVQVENERNSPAPYKVGVYFSLFPILWDSSWNNLLSSDRPWEAELDRHRARLGASFWNLKVGVLIGLWMGLSSPFLPPLWSLWPQLLGQVLSSTSYLNAELF